MQNRKFELDFDYIILFIVLLETFCAMRSIIRYGEKYIVSFGILLCFFKFVKNSTLLLTLENKIWITFCAFVILSMGWTLSTENTANCLRVLLFAVALCMVIRNEMFIRNYLKVVKIGCVAAAVSIIAELFNPTIISRYFWFFFERHYSVDIAILKAGDMYNGGYSGLVGEKGDAAYFMCLGLSIILSQCYAKKKLDKKNFICIALLLIALLMTGKRMMFLISMTLPLMLILISDIKRENKIKQIIGIAAAGVIAFTIIINVAPDVGRVFGRFNVANGEDAALSERYILWGICRKMFSEAPILGNGLSTFSSYSYTHGNTGIPFAHNIYLQLLGETGMSGAALLAGFLISTIIKDINIYRLRKYLKQEELYWLYYSFCGQYIFLIYGLSGNTFYYRFEFIIYFMCLLFLDIISLQFGKLDKYTALRREQLLT